MTGSAALSALVEALLPSVCLNCGESLSGADRGLCGECWAQVIPLAGTRCERCGGPADTAGDPCLACAADQPPQRASLAWGEHAGVLRQVLLHLKHHQRDELAAPLGRRLAARVAAEKWAAEVSQLTAVPSHPAHRLRRGHSAAELVADAAAHALGLPHDRVLRRRGLKRQTGRSRAQRLRLSTGIFSARRPVHGARVLVVDDVTTTGTTLRRAARTLLDAGADSVFCATVAYSPDARRMT